MMIPHLRRRRAAAAPRGRRAAAMWCNWPDPCNLRQWGTQGLVSWLAANPPSSDGNSTFVYLNTATGPGRLTRALRSAGRRPLAMECSFQAVGIAQNEWVELRALDAGDAVLAKVRLTAGDMSGTEGYLSCLLTTNDDPVGLSRPQLCAKYAGGFNAQFSVELVLLPSVAGAATFAANAAVGHQASAVNPDGIDLVDMCPFGAAIGGHGSVAKLELLSSGTAGSPSALYLKGAAAVDDPWVFVGDSIARCIARGFWSAEPSGTTQDAGCLPVPVLDHARDGRYLTALLGGQCLENHYAGLAGAYRNVVVGCGTNDYSTSNAANRAAIEAALTAVVTGLRAAGKQVCLCTIPPRGPASARDAATIAAVQGTNAALATLAAAQGCRFFDVYTLARAAGADTWRAGWSTDGVHPNYTGRVAIARAMAAVLAPHFDPASTWKPL